MKRIVFIIIVLIGLGTVGCEKKIVGDECPGCTTCFAPTNASVSWTEYNKTAELWAYFNNHDSTLMQHIGDTILLCGWVYYPDHEAGEPTFDIMIPDWSVEAGVIYLVDNEDHHYHGIYRNAVVVWPAIGPYMTHEDSVWYEEHMDFREHFPEFLLKKWYITARIEIGTNLGLGECSNYAPKYKIIEMDTLKKDYEKK